MLNKKNKRILKIIATAIISIAIIITSIGQIRIATAAKEAKQLAKNAGLTYDYEVNTATAEGDSKTFFIELCRLATWMLDKERLINETFDYDALKAENDRGLAEPTGFEPREKLLEYARRQQWKKERAVVRDKTEACIEQLFGDGNHRGRIKKTDVISGIWNGGLHELSYHQTDFENENTEGLYDALAINLDWDWAPLPMDVAYELFPEKMLTASEADLEAAMRSHDLYELKQAISAAYAFGERYNVAPKNFYDAKDLRDKLQKERDERLTDPPSGQTYSGKKKKAPKYSYSDEPEIDPDDYDMDAYYADNWDEYDDVEDAAEGFLDDDSEWDDY